MPKLTKSAVEAADPRSKQYTIWCADLPGFGAYIHPSGKRTYFVDYRNKEGVRRRMTIGRHGLLTAEEARKVAIATLGEAVRGDDPAQDRATRRKSLNMAELCDTYFDAAMRGLIMGKRGQPKKVSTLATDRGRIDRHIKPLLGRRLVRDVTSVDVHRFIRDVAAGKTAAVETTENKRGKAVVTGGAGTAARTAGLLGGILTYAVSEGVIPYNPAVGVKRPAGKRRKRRLTPVEYRQLGRALAAAGEGGETPQAIHGAWLLALTGCRLGEIEGLRWVEVDSPAHCFRLSQTKEGASVRPIGQHAFEILTRINGREGGEFVLSGVHTDGPYGGMPGAWKRIVARAHLTGVTPHTLRHSYASVAGDLGFTESTIAALLGHAAGSVTSRYVHHLDNLLVAAADKVVSAIHNYMTG